MAFSEDATRLLRDNLKTAYSKIAAIAIAALAWTAPYKAAEYLGVQSRSHRWLLVLAFYGIVLVATLLLFLYRSLREAYDKLGPSTPTQKALAELAAKFIGVEQVETIDTCTINADGSSESIQDICLIAHSANVTRIERTSSTPSVPADVKDTLSVLAEAKQHNGIKISAEILKSTPNQCIWSINFLPALRRGESIKFRYKIKSPGKSFAGTVEEMKRRGLDDEHLSHQISYPTTLFLVKVTFATEVNTVAFDVWNGRGGLRHMDEYIRITKEGLFSSALDEDDRLYAILRIPYPVFGLRYLITWRPAKKEAGE